METPIKFFLIFVVTILFTRIFLFLKPTPSPTIGGFRLHHWMFGIVIAVFGSLIGSLYTYAIGLGLFVDELTFLLLGGENHCDNYSMKSLIGTGILVIFVFLIKEYLLIFFQ